MKLTRTMIDAALKRHLDRERKVLDAAQFYCGHSLLPRPYVRSQLRDWFSARTMYLYRELQKVPE